MIMEQEQVEQVAPSYQCRLGKIKSKSLIIVIICGSDLLQNCLPTFSKSCKSFKKLYYEHGMYFTRNGSYCWQKQAIPKEPNSLIKREQDINLISQGLKGKRFRLEKIFDIEKDGNDPDEFHKTCKGISHTICILRTNYYYTFGGYTRVPWESCYGTYKQDETAFLFSLTKQSLHPVIPGQEQFATFHSQDCFCIFGSGDLLIGKQHRSSQLGKKYQLTENIQTNREASRYFAATATFSDIEFQVYKVLFSN
ncbi:hypothetical protein FGO68_gene14794 [Halteria grandinella]|uniref:TLDc domain-containing protein n=1 Tax=Halteria grandinella TaxID=5974 RepID=A0A8J8NPM7_HALGN|nr:hypothetical protein FGO68_gene14794 [Halteria grandinella]